MMPTADRCSHSFAEEFLTALGVEARAGSSLRVLDVGVGRARIPIEICAGRPDIAITGVDSQPSILRRAREDIERAGLEGAVRVQRGNACALPFPDASFDAVISNALLHHLPRQRKALSEMIRVLRPEGLLFVRDSLAQADASIIAATLLHTAGERRRRIERARLPIPLSLDDALQLAAEAGLPAEWVRPCGPRHWLLSG